MELGRRGVWLSLDCFGLETAFYPLAPAISMPNDGGRLSLAEAVLAAGLGDRLLLAQDICQKHRLAAFGGHGYDHLIRDVVPMLVARGHDARPVGRDPGRQPGPVPVVAQRRLTSEGRGRRARLRSPSSGRTRPGGATAAGSTSPPAPR